MMLTVVRQVVCSDREGGGLCDVDCFFLNQLYFTACSITEAILHAWDCLYIICIASYCVYIYTGCIVPLKH